MVKIVHIRLMAQKLKTVNAFQGQEPLPLKGPVVPALFGIDAAINVGMTDQLLRFNDSLSIQNKTGKLFESVQVYG